MHGHHNIKKVAIWFVNHTWDNHYQISRYRL